MIGARLFFLQRLSALVMIPLVFIHLGTMIYAIQGGLSGEEILSRTQGSILWGGFYGLFILAASIHAAIGLRVIIFEFLKLDRTVLDILSVGILAVLLYFGTISLWAVILS